MEGMLLLQLRYSTQIQPVCTAEISEISWLCSSLLEREQQSLLASINTFTSQDNPQGIQGLGLGEVSLIRQRVTGYLDFLVSW